MPDAILAAKVCTQCGEAKPATAEFFPSEGARLRHQCKSCRNAAKITRRLVESDNARAKRLEQMRQYAAAGKQARSEYRRRYYEENRDFVLAQQKAAYQADPSRHIENAKKWRLENPARKLAANRKWAALNPEKHIASARKSKRLRRQSAAVRANDSVSAQVRLALRGAKKGCSWETLLGYTLGDLTAHLESKFRVGMSWANYGTGWHIDHIRPVSSFDLMADGELRKCWALSNLQPLWALDNIRKGAKLNWQQSQTL